jgi:hypothetical protein
MMTITLFALLGDDIKLAFFTQKDDNVFNWLCVACMILFTIEIVLTTIAKPRSYLGSFLFWLDVVSTVSLLVDLTWVMDYLTGIPEQGGDMIQMARLGRTARMGSKAGRI